MIRRINSFLKNNTFSFVQAMVLLSLCTMFLWSCDKLPESGGLPGNWQLMTVERKGTVTDVKDRKIFWAERIGMMQFCVYGGATISVGEEQKDFNVLYCHVFRVGNTLLLNDFCYPASYIVGDGSDNTYIPFHERDNVSVLGIYPTHDAGTDCDGISCHCPKIKAEFRIMQLSDDRMVLHSDSSSLVFRKF